MDRNAEDRILQSNIRNLPAPPSPLRETETRKRVGGKVETHTFYVSCGECTITLKDMQLQLELPVDGSVLTETVHTDWKALRRNFDELDEDSTEVEREQHARAYILMIIEGILMPDTSQNLVYLRWLLKLVNFKEAVMGVVSTAILHSEANYPYTFPFVTRWNHGLSYAKLLKELRDLRLLLDQQSEAEKIGWAITYEEATMATDISKVLRRGPVVCTYFRVDTDTDAHTTP
ncbi:hypothetical protein PVK06_020359 [Gossypium arboreum]|uniref:Aminotransferase-like plant mobile domain-containing protein n=1 Tax=Gossypium arboreum TaxID=29729 RepID=A0ABR0PM50_GOSAR|nr:hypothetical protein PVK06_020359 [Gossypium arboreum]